MNLPPGAQVARQHSRRCEPPSFGLRAAIIAKARNWTSAIHHRAAQMARMLDRVCSARISKSKACDACVQRRTRKLSRIVPPPATCVRSIQIRRAVSLPMMTICGGHSRAGRLSRASRKAIAWRALDAEPVRLELDRDPDFSFGDGLFQKAACRGSSRKDVLPRDQARTPRAGEAFRARYCPTSAGGRGA